MNTIGPHLSLHLEATGGVGALHPQPAASQSTFKEFLLESIQEVNSMQQEADRAVEMLFTGEEINPAEVLTAVQKADLAFRMMMQIRNKLVQAYEEVKNIRV
jgi:flagellar hook-basal body complex protein FliE